MSTDNHLEFFGEPDRTGNGLPASTRTGSTVITEAQRDQHQRVLAAATADNTRRAYRSAVRHFQTWGGALPCDEATVTRYLLAFADTLNPRTLSLRLTALSHWHTYQGFPDPAAAPAVRKTLKGIERLHGKPKKKAKALPAEDLEVIVSRLSQITDLKSLRDSALLQLAYYGAFRRSEVVSLTVADLSWEPEGLVITLPRSKTDQTGEGITKAIPFGEGANCPASALHRWLQTAGIQDGALFRSITRWGKLGNAALKEGSVNAVLAARAAESGLTYMPQLSSHSLRRGLATSAYRAGADIRNIKRQGGWRHDGTVQGYIEEAAQFEDNAAGLLLRGRKISSKQG